MIRYAPCLLIGILTFPLQGCVVKRTTESGGRVTEEKYIVKRPVKNLIQNTEIE